MPTARGHGRCFEGCARRIKRDMKEEATMKRYLVASAAAAGALALLLPSIARAQDTAEEPTGRRIPAPSRALELSVGTGYTQPFGMLQSGVPLNDVARAGIGAEAGLGYRIDPHWG